MDDSQFRALTTPPKDSRKYQWKSQTRKTLSGKPIIIPKEIWEKHLDNLTPEQWATCLYCEPEAAMTHAGAKLNDREFERISERCIQITLQHQPDRLSPGQLTRFTKIAPTSALVHASHLLEENQLWAIAIEFPELALNSAHKNLPPELLEALVKQDPQRCLATLKKHQKLAYSLFKIKEKLPEEILKETIPIIAGGI